MTTAVVVQARMASTRLPGKVLLSLAGRTVLSHVLARCHAIANSDVVCCAVPDCRGSDPVAEEAERCGAAVVRGSESDVLGRYRQAAEEVRAKVVMRVTSDCPLIDPAVCANVIALLENEDADYACNNMPPSFPHGLDCEAFTRAWLERAAHMADRPSEREHVTPFIRNHPEAKKVNLTCPDSGVADHCWTLDTEADWRFMEALFARLSDGPGGWPWRVPLGIVAADPELAELNAGQDRDDGLKRSHSVDREAEFDRADA